MTKRELVRRSREKIAKYCREKTPKEQFEQMVAEGVINSEGEVLVTKEEREAGHPTDNVPGNNQK